MNGRFSPDPEHLCHDARITVGWIDPSLENTTMNTLRIGLVAATLLALGLPTITTSHAEIFQSNQKGKFCRDLKNIYDNNVTVSRENSRRGRAAKETAANVKILAEGNNCNWTVLLSQGSKLPPVIAGSDVSTA
jgi:hypothetical protein